MRTGHNSSGVYALIPNTQRPQRGLVYAARGRGWDQSGAWHSEHMNTVTSTLTAYLTPNTGLSTPRLRYCVPKINNTSAEQLHRAMLPLLPYKKPYCHWPPRVCCHTLTTHWLPASLRTRQQAQAVLKEENFQAELATQWRLKRVVVVAIVFLVLKKK